MGEIKTRISFSGKKALNNLLVFLFICISGNPAFSMDGTVFKLVYGLMVIILLISAKFKITLESWHNIVKWSSFLSFIFFVQFITLKHITVMGSLSYIFKFVCAILLVNKVGKGLPETFFREMVFICLISLPLYLLNLTGFRFDTNIPIMTKGESIIIYTQTWDDPSSNIFRNSGLFWEPGAFAGYIIFAFILNIDRLPVIWHKHKIGIAIMSIALLTTFSTTGYIAFALLALFFVHTVSKKKIVSLILILSLIIGTGIAFINFDFLGAKIQKQLTKSAETNESELNYTRFGSILFDIQYIATHPIFGNGLDNSTRFRFHNSLFSDEDLARFGNGFSGCIASMGILFMLVYLASIYKNKHLKAKIFTVFLVILLLQGEYYLNYPAFILLPFIDYGSKIQQKKIRKKYFVWKKRPQKVLLS